jgi:predicted nucleotidyltransferase
MKQDEEIKNIIIDTLKKSDVKKASLFGSVARGESNKKSDVDLLIEFKGKKSLLDLVRLKMKLEELLGKKVDILTYKSINPLIKKRILNEQKVIL